MIQPARISLDHSALSTVLFGITNEEIQSNKKQALNEVKGMFTTVLRPVPGDAKPRQTYVTFCRVQLCPIALLPGVLFTTFLLLHPKQNANEEAELLHPYATVSCLLGLLSSFAVSLHMSDHGTRVKAIEFGDLSGETDSHICLKIQEV